MGRTGLCANESGSRHSGKAQGPTAARLDLRSKSDAEVGAGALSSTMSTAWWPRSPSSPIARDLNGLGRRRPSPSRVQLSGRQPAARACRARGRSGCAAPDRDQADNREPRRPRSRRGPRAVRLAVLAMLGRSGLRPRPGRLRARRYDRQAQRETPATPPSPTLPPPPSISGLISRHPRESARKRGSRHERPDRHWIPAFALTTGLIAVAITLVERGQRTERMRMRHPSPFDPVLAPLGPHQEAVRQDCDEHSSSWRARRRTQARRM